MSYEIYSTENYDEWFGGLKDRTSKARIVTRLARAEKDNFGDHKQLSDDLFELRFTFGGAFRIYYTIRDGCVVLLLNGGIKSGQNRDIARVKKILGELE